MTNKRATAPQKKTPAKITQQHLDSASVPESVAQYEFRPYEPLPNVIPAGKEKAAMAMDTSPYELLNQMNLDVDYSGFMGFPALATLAQQVEYSNMSQVMGEEVVRNWIEVKSLKAGDDDIDKMEALLEKYDIKRLIHKAVVQDSQFGGCHIFVDVDASDTELANPLVLDPRAIKMGKLKGFRTVDPTWVYPALYNTRFPLKADFYKPSAWYVMGQTVHESRFIDIVSRPVPDILKPSYNFFGLSLTQLMMSYVNDWRDVKRNVVSIIKTLRMRGLATDMDARLQEPGAFDKRLKLFTQYQDNMGIWAYDKSSEEFVHMQTSLSDLSNLLSNYQDQLCIPARVTNLKLLGNAPAGLNASGDSELETWHETISGYQDGNIRRPLETIFKIIQLAEFGEIKPDLYFEFRPLDELSDLDKATINKIKVETVAAAADSMLVSTEEGRSALSEIEGGGFENLPEGYVPEDDSAGETDEP